MDKSWVNKTSSFKKAEKFNRKYYLNMSRIERLEIVQFLREIYCKVNRKIKNYEGRERLRRIIKVIQ